MNHLSAPAASLGTSQSLLLEIVVALPSEGDFMQLIQLMDYKVLDGMWEISRAVLINSMMSSGNIVLRALPLQGLPIAAVLTAGPFSMSSKASCCPFGMAPENIFVHMKCDY